MSNHFPPRNNNIQGIEPVTEKIINYINVDSSQRNKNSTNTYFPELYTLPPYPLEFTNGSSILKINLPNHPFKTDDLIVLNNVISKYSILHNILEIKKNSSFVRVHHPNHGLSLYGLYNPMDPTQFIPVEYVDGLPTSFNENDNIPDTLQYYILKNNTIIDISIQLSNVKGIDFLRTMIGNISTNYLNKKHRVYLLFTKNGNIFVHDPNYYLIKLEKKSSSNYSDSKNFLKDKSGNPTKNIATNTVHIRFYNLFGVPLKYLNSGTPTNENMANEYLTIISTTDNTFSVNIGYNAIVDPNFNFYNPSDLENDESNIGNIMGAARGGGNQVFVRKVEETINGYPNPNQYKYNLDKTYKNIIEAKIVGSIFPNSQRIINNDNNDNNNNKLYWRNLSDGDYIYYIEIPPGNYSTLELANAIEKEFSNTIRYRYSEEYRAGIHPEIISQATPTDSLKYDENGLYKYHIVEVSISEITDIVSLSTYREINLRDVIGPGPITHRILVVPDYYIEFTMAENLQIDVGSGGTNIVPFEFTPFDYNTEELYIYFTPNTQSRIKETYPYAYYNLYQFIENIPGDEPVAGYNTFRAGLNVEKKLLFNFFRTKGIYPMEIAEHEVNSINTTTLLQNFYYDYLTNIVTMVNHQLGTGDIIITDQFNGYTNQNQIFVYEIKNVIDADKFLVIKIIPGKKYKFIYDSLIINFSTNTDNMVYWLDQITDTEPIVSLPSPYTMNNNTLSMVMVKPMPENKQILRIYHPNHQLEKGNKITISGSGPINQVPPNIINRSHIIHRIIDNNHYEILMDKYTTISPQQPFDYPNGVIIRYPDIFQMFFNYPDTLGKILNFQKVGENNSITHYNHTIKNTDPYINEYSDEIIVPKKLDMTGPTYFYISILELGNHHNTKPVANVFAIGRWFDEPGNIVFDSVVPTVRIFNPPLSSLSQLNISIYHPNGKLVEFNGLDHQFTLEIVEERNSIK